MWFWFPQGLCSHVFALRGTTALILQLCYLVRVDLTPASLAWMTVPGLLIYRSLGYRALQQPPTHSSLTPLAILLLP